jgi:PAS domain S-box-containing protein
MSDNYLKDEFYRYLKQNEILLQEIVSFSKKYFFVWDYQNQESLWISNSIWKKLGFLDNNQENDLKLWKSKLNLLITPEKNITSILDTDNPKLDLEFKNNNEDHIVTTTSLYTIKNTANQVTRIIGVLENDWNNDLSRYEQDRLKFISDNITDGIFVVEDEEMVFASKPYLDMIGLTLEQKRILRKGNVLHLVHPDDLERVDAVINEAFDNKQQSVKFVFKCKKANGEYFWREDIMNIYFNIGDVKVKTITITRDVTEEKLRELESLKRLTNIDTQNKLLVSLYSTTGDLTIDEKISFITKIATEGLEIDRSNYWEIEGDSLVCKNLVDTFNKTAFKNQKLNVRDLPKYFEAMNTQTALIADDVMTNTHTSELIDSYLKPLGITDMLDIPVRENGKMHGVLCFEHRDEPRIWSEHDVAFARALADFLSLALEEDKRKRIERELMQNQEKLKFISENTSDGIIVFENSQLSYISPAYTKLSGYSLEYSMGLTIEQIFAYIHPDDIDRIKEYAYGQLANQKQQFSYEYRFRGPDGIYYWREDSANVLYNEDGTYSKYIAISRDVTERKKTEEKLIQSEQQLRLISENSSDGFVIMENRRISYVSPSYTNFMGYSQEEVYGMTPREIMINVHPDDRERVDSFIRNNLKNNVTSFKCEFRFKDKSGKYQWREDSTNVIYNEDRSGYKYIIISRDINERKEIESQLIESERQLRLISENTSDGVAVIENGVLTYVSPSYLRLLQYPENHYKGFTLEDIFNSFHPDDLKEVKPYIYESLALQKTEIQYEVRFKDALGNYHWREDSANVLYDENGKYSKYIVVTRDISARKESEKEKNRLYKITEKQNQKLINFTHIVSHDIRSHTSNLAMILELFEETNDAAEQKEYFAMLKQSTNKLSDTIFYLNETVAVQSGANTDKMLLNLKAEIQKSITGINAIVKTTNALIGINVPNDLFVEATQSYLESIIFNLLTNAIKYKSPDRKPVINIQAKKIGDEIQLTFSDNGMGIDMEKYGNKIFGMYKTFHGNPDAVGLGLFMVKNQLESMGGRIEIESKVNIGTTFNLFFI